MIFFTKKYYSQIHIGYLKKSKKQLERQQNKEETFTQDKRDKITHVDPLLAHLKSFVSLFSVAKHSTSYIFSILDHVFSFWT